MENEGRYDVSDSVEAQFEPGSNETVLRNLRGIKTAEEMDRVEAQELARTVELLVGEYDATHRFTVQDIRHFHQTWLGGIYAWAGEYRQVNVSKGGFLFAAAHLVPKLMNDFAAGPLVRHTPCKAGDSVTMAAALAETHVELVLIHPFREGNGRTARLLSTLMSLQAGIPFLDFRLIAEEGKANYFAAVQTGLDRNYEPMTALFLKIIEQSIAAR